LAILLHPLLTGRSGSPLVVAVGLAYPLFDLLMLSLVMSIAALKGRSISVGWWQLIAGLTVFAIADIVYAQRVAHHAYTLATPLDGLWAFGLTLLTAWAIRPHPAVAGNVPPDQPAAPAVPAVATLSALVVLAVATRAPVPTLAIVLALATVAVAAGRIYLAMRHLRKMADLRQQARTDDLTGLPNRRAFYSAGEGLLLSPDRPRALLLLDLDRFKEINDSLGHHVGDQLLVQTGLRLAGQLGDADLLARLGGDEFAVLVDGATPAKAAEIANRLRRALTRPFLVEGLELHADASIGIALFPDHGSEISALLRRADIAMYRAKATGEGHSFYSNDRDSHSERRLSDIDELRTALEQDQLILHYQPKIELATGMVTGVEALVRWDHPTRGLLYPDAFLALVEESGLMRAMTRQVLSQALRQAAIWRDGGRPLQIAVNLSPSSLGDVDLPDQIRRMLAACDVPGSVLQLEITEEFLMADRARAGVILAELRRLGVQIAIDDFGTGYSSLTYLRELPIDELKLDRSFVFPMADDARAAALVASTIGLAHSLGLRLVAEGVENAASYAELQLQGCDQAQGYHLCRPLPVAELDLWLSTVRLQILTGQQ
jgi:diguanylate cyclase